MEELRTYYQIPSIAHFCSLFRDCLNLPDFDYEDLEFAFLSKISSDNPELGLNESNLILRLICALLKGYFETHINHTNWEKYLQKLFKIQWEGIEKRRSPFVSFDDKGEEISVSFDDLPLRTKVDVIHCLCDYRLFVDDISQRIGDINADDYRVEPLGTDSKGYLYWYFYGTRLYRENPSVAQNIEDNYKRFDELIEKRAKQIKQELKKQELLETRSKKEEEKPKKSRGLPPKVLGFRSGLRERKSESPLPNGITNSRVLSNSVPKSDSNDKKFVSIEDIKDLKEIDLSSDKLREAWSLVCETEQDWKDFTNNLAKSKNKSELNLYKVLSKNFVPKISEIFEIREKEKQKVERQKLIELLPRRLSSRIELKKIRKEKETIEEQEANRRKEEESQQRNQETDRQRSERIKQERENRAQKRLQLVEERAERALKREKFELNGIDSESSNQNMETNNDFDYITEDYIEQPVDPTDSIETFYEGLGKVINTVKTNRDAWPFIEPVDGSKFPMYYHVITEPMDLSKIEKKIELREYQNFEEIENDFKLMVNNCETFNGPKNGYTLMSYGVWRAFKKASLKYLEKEMTYNESTAFIYPQKVTNNNIKPAIEAKKRKMKNKRRSTFKALHVLAEAAEKAVEANESRVIRIIPSISSSVGESSPRSTLSSDSNACVSLKESINKVENPLQIHGDMWANYLFNANNSATAQQIPCNTSQTSINPSVNENLTFKSLDEWSKSIKQSGNYVVLPQHAVIISSSQFTHCTNGPRVDKPQVSLKVVSTENSSVSTSTVHTSNGLQTFTSSVILNNENARKDLVNSDPKRLVIKLSRCESQQGWRPVTLITSTSQNNLNTNNSLLNGQTITTSAQQFQGLRSIPSNCVPVKKRFVNQDFNTETTSEPKPSMALNMSEIIHNSNPNSQSFQITGIERNQNSNLKVYRLKKWGQSSTVYHSIPSTDQSCVAPKLVLMPFDKQTPNGNTSSSGLS